jgi:prevent-host-death family protein
MRHLQLRDAKARLSALIDAAEQGEGSIITRHGKAAAVVIGYAEWQRLSNLPSFGALLAASPLHDADLPEREAWAPADGGL